MRPAWEPQFSWWALRCIGVTKWCQGRDRVLERPETTYTVGTGWPRFTCRMVIKVARETTGGSSETKYHSKHIIHIELPLCWQDDKNCFFSKTVLQNPTKCLSQNRKEILSGENKKHRSKNAFKQNAMQLVITLPSQLQLLRRQCTDNAVVIYCKSNLICPHIIHDHK